MTKIIINLAYFLDSIKEIIEVIVENETNKKNKFYKLHAGCLIINLVTTSFLLIL